MRGGLTAPLARLIAGQICVHAAMAGTRMAAPLLALNQGYSTASVGILLALFALTQVFLALPAGRYADRHGLKRPVAWSVVAASVGAGAAAAFPIFPVLYFAALMTGAATGGAVISLQRHVGRAAETPTQLKQVFSWLAIGPAIANFVGPFCAGLLIDNAGYRAAFLFMALLPLATWFWVRNIKELPPVVRAGDAAAPRAWELLREPGFRRLMVVNWFLSSCWDVHTFVVPILGHERGLSASVIGSILGVFAMAAAAIRVVMPLVAARLREWKVLVFAMVCTATLFGIYPLLHSAAAMGLCSILLGLALGLVQPMVMSMLHQITPEERHGEALGLRLMVINASSVAMPMLFGLGSAIGGVASVFWFVGAVVGSGAKIAAGLRHTALHRP